MKKLCKLISDWYIDMQYVGSRRDLNFGYYTAPDGEVSPAVVVDGLACFIFTASGEFFPFDMSKLLTVKGKAPLKAEQLFSSEGVNLKLSNTTYKFDKKTECYMLHNGKDPVYLDKKYLDLFKDYSDIDMLSFKSSQFENIGRALVLVYMQGDLIGCILPYTVR